MAIINKVADTNIIQYVQNQTDSFNKTAFNEVDSVVFAQFTYLNFSRFVSSSEQNQVWVSISSLYKAEEFSHMLDLTLYPASNKNLLEALCASPRYRDVLINFYDEKFDVQAQEQFCAITFKLPNDELVIGFRGTDSTVIGWKEDFNMLYLSPVPCQVSAVNYFETVAQKVQGNFHIVGHSKGGNLAVYSSLFANEEAQSRIINVYDLDGPGFQTKVWEEKNSEEITSKIIKISPEGSFIGFILNSPIPIKVIKSSKIGLFQHETYTWLIDGNEFIESDEVTSRVKYVDKTLDELLNNLSIDQKRLVIDTVFSVISTTNAQRLSDVMPLIIRERETIIKAIKQLDEPTALLVKDVLKNFMISYIVPINTNKKEEKAADEKKERLSFDKIVKTFTEIKQDFNKSGEEE
ncbi:MAG: Mbeg1-like protein [Clostridia bacterium]